MAKVTLDMETFKALASSTRLQVLRALDERRKTLSELAKELDLNKATVHEHLGILLATGLIKKRDDEGRKWIYYELTWQGERLLHPQETTTFAVLLGFSVAAAGGGFLMLGAALNWWWADKQLASDDAGMRQGLADDAQPSSDAAPEGGSTNTSTQTATSTGASNGGASPEQSQIAADPGSSAEAAPDAGHSQGFFATDDPDGILAILLLATAVLLAVFAYVIRRARRGSA